MPPWKTPDKITYQTVRSGRGETSSDPRPMTGLNELPRQRHDELPQRLHRRGSGGIVRGHQSRVPEHVLAHQTCELDAILRPIREAGQRHDQDSLAAPDKFTLARDRVDLCDDR